MQDIKFATHISFKNSPMSSLNDGTKCKIVRISGGGMGPLGVLLPHTIVFKYKDAFFNEYSDRLDEHQATLYYENSEEAKRKLLESLEWN